MTEYWQYYGTIALPLRDFLPPNIFFTPVIILQQLSAGRFKMASSYGSLVREAIVLLDRFNAGRQCLDDFMEDASKDLQVGGLTLIWTTYSNIRVIIVNEN